ncbi:Uncharacterized protein, possibly involved in aromatic compounds catabolism [Serratia plymuthica]|nr:Uncharacterized protein, possibly involved in aromatic compounds catabolism [Serratia plymuthica]
MSTTPLTLDAARQKIGEIFVYHMPFNRELGLELRRFEDDYVELSFTNQPKLVGNAAQKILHGGVIASVLDVAAGLACAGSVLMRMDPLIEEEVASRLSRMGTIDLRVDYLRPAAASISSPPPASCAAATKWRSPAPSCITTMACISPAPPPPIWSGDCAR